MTITIKRAHDDQQKAIYSIMALAGEHMHRVLNLSHWHPFSGTEKYLRHLEGRDLYVVYEDQLLIGTFNLSTKPEPYYHDDMSNYWVDSNAPATYFSGFALLPSHQQKGIGTQCMKYVDQTVKQQTDHQYIRFDGVANHKKLIHFYSRLGYEKRGVLPVYNTSVMCFEKDLSKSIQVDS